MQLAALGNLYGDMLAQKVLYALGEGMCGVAAVAQQAFHPT